MAVLKAKAVEAALRKCRGNMAAVGRKFGVTRAAVQQYVASRPALQAVCTECREAMTDTAESALFKAVRKGEAWAVCFYLKCLAKGRGYVEKPADEKPPEKQEVMTIEQLARIITALGGRVSPATGAGGTGTPALPPGAVGAERGAATGGVPESSG